MKKTENSLISSDSGDYVVELGCLLIYKHSGVFTLSGYMNFL